MLEANPHIFLNELERVDFLRFSSEFSRAICINIPTLEAVAFLDSVPLQPANSSEENSEDKSIREATQEAAASCRPVLKMNTLYLPFSVEETTVIAKVKGLDDYMIRKVGKDWLDALQPLLLREFLLIKRANIDSLTGLLSSLCLHEFLDGKTGTLSGVLVLLSVAAKGSNVFYVRRHQTRMVSLLKNFVNERFPLYYIGQSCFAMICQDIDQNFSSEFSPLLLNYFKREACSRVHVATLDLAHFDFDLETSPLASEAVMKKAWAALHIASKRGPFAFCNASVLENKETHPLASPSKQLKRWLQKSARNCEDFSLLQFVGSNSALFEEIEKNRGAKGQVVTEGEYCFLFLPSVNRNKIKTIAKQIIDGYAHKQARENTPNVGIAIYSPKERSKSDTLFNCRKALCHAAFLDPGAVVICDAVSFNISGDIYYGEGDLVKAVSEYKKGLQLNSKDGNLLNSLGVCYAQMNRHKDAVYCFEQACKSKKDRFMALYNLGFEQQQQKDNCAAIKSFTVALNCTVAEEQLMARRDISFQLAVLCCMEQEYKNGLALLLPWFENEANGKALKYLGELYAGLADYKKAMKYLQLAMQYDEYDAEVLSLLGEIYLQENEGDDIALRFCEKAVELSPDSLKLKIRLAIAQTHCGDFAAAEKNLQPCLRKAKTRLAALRQKGLLAKEQGKIKTAAKWQKKAEQFAEKIQNR